jgi:hypothetical protein
MHAANDPKLKRIAVAQANFERSRRMVSALSSQTCASGSTDDVKQVGKP